MLRLRYILIVLAASLGIAHAQDPGVTGDWREPGGSVLRIFSCGTDVCMKVMLLRTKNPLRIDIHDPDPARRSLPVCYMQIGYGFHPEGPDVAKDGRIYDPMSGHTYHAQMHIEAGQLRLRGYILFPALGRTEKWTRVTDFHQACH